MTLNFPSFLFVIGFWFMAEKNIYYSVYEFSSLFLDDFGRGGDEEWVFLIDGLWIFRLFLQRNDSVFLNNSNEISKILKIWFKSLVNLDGQGRI